MVQPFKPWLMTAGDRSKSLIHRANFWKGVTSLMGNTHSWKRLPPDTPLIFSNIHQWDSIKLHPLMAEHYTREDKAALLRAVRDLERKAGSEVKKTSYADPWPCPYCTGDRKLRAEAILELDNEEIGFSCVRTK